MPEIIIYTNDGDCANGVAEIQPFTTGDSSDWTLRFNNGTDFYAVSDVTMRVGHVNGLPDSTYGSAFKWSDRKGTESTASIVVAAGVPTLTLTPAPVGGLVGTDGVYILRGPELDGAITSIQVLNTGSFDTLTDYTATPVLEIDRTRAGSYSTGVATGDGNLSAIYSNSPSGTSFALATATLGQDSTDLQALVGNSAIFNGGVGYVTLPFSGSPQVSSLVLTGNFSISFSMVSLFPKIGIESIFQGSQTASGQQYTQTMRMYATTTSWSMTLAPPSEVASDFVAGGYNINAIDSDKEYDYVISRTGSTWNVAVSREGAAVTSGSSTGWSNDVPITNIGSGLRGIIRNVTFKQGSTVVASYVGGGAAIGDWADTSGGTSYSATSVANLEEFTGQGSGRNITGTTLVSGGSGFQFSPIVALNSSGTVVPSASNTAILPTFKALGNWPEYQLPFMRDESGNDIIAATTLSPYSDGDINGSAQFNHSTLVIRPKTVASASNLSAGSDATGPKWTATMNPVNAYTNARLSLRNSTQLDLQIRGDGRTLFQGQLTILNKMT